MRKITPERRAELRAKTKEAGDGIAILPPLRVRKATMSRNELRALLASDPAALLRLLEPGALPPSEQTFAAEYAESLPGAGPALLRLLDSPHAIVREGALHGLAGHWTAEAIERVRRVADEDPSPGVLAYARDSLDFRGDEDPD